jgi:uncharacterized membrane protein
MSTVEPSYSGPPPVAPAPTVRPRNGLGVAALVIGVASLVAVVSFVLFPLGLIAGVVGVVLGIVALTGARAATNRGQAVTGLVCSIIALIAAITLTVRVGTWAARNTGTFTRFDRCLARAGDRAKVADCIARFANEVRP